LPASHQTRQVSDQASSEKDKGRWGAISPFLFMKETDMITDRLESTQNTDYRHIQCLKLNSPFIETERLLLRPPLQDDIPDIVQLANNYHIARMLGTLPHPYFTEDAQEFLENIAGHDGNCVYAITSKDTGSFMGICGLHEDPAQFELPFIGYWLGQPYWHHGYASEAARAMVALFFKVTIRDALMISARQDNPASRRIIEKCGGRFWKTGEQYNQKLGELQRLDHFRVSRDDWIAAAEVE
jgi:RimJ/RimL family protein N-acetyltransferase